MTPDHILIHYAEVALKGRNRRDFELILRDNIRLRFHRAGLHWPLQRGHARIIVTIPPAQADRLDTARQLLGEVAGIATFAPACFLDPEAVARAAADPELEPIRSALLSQVGTPPTPDAPFALRINRADKRFPIASDEVARRLGNAVRAASPWQAVDLNRPCQAFHVDIYPEGAYVYSARLKGPGGLPVFSGGHVMALLSGGIDSPVAAYLMARRGCRVDLLHITASHVGRDQAEDLLVSRVARSLSRFTLRSRLFLVPYTHFDLALQRQLAAAQGFEMILFRRFAARAAAAVAGRAGAGALACGDSLGQVASQTLENMVTCEAATPLPMLRPLVGWDKQEIIDLARRIGTFELSLEPYKDCCALLGQQPRTRTSPSQLEALEQRLLPDYDAVLGRSLDDGLCLEFEAGERRRRPARSTPDHAAV